MIKRQHVDRAKLVSKSLAASVTDRRDVCRACQLVMEQGFYQSFEPWSGLPTWHYGLRCINSACSFFWPKLYRAAETASYARVKIDPPRFDWRAA